MSMSHAIYIVQSNVYEILFSWLYKEDCYRMLTDKMGKQCNKNWFIISFLLFFNKTMFLLHKDSEWIYNMQLVRTFKSVSSHGVNFCFYTNEIFLPGFNKIWILKRKIELPPIPSVYPKACAAHSTRTWFIQRQILVQL